MYSNSARGDLPSHFESEQAVLGCALSGTKYFTQIASLLKAEDFLDPKHQIIYKALEQLYLQNRSIDDITVANELQKDGKLEAVGGLAYLSALPATSPFLSSIEEYAKIVHEKSMLRQLLYVSDEVLAACYKQNEKPEHLIEHATQKFYDIKMGKESDGPTPVHLIIQKTLEELSDPEYAKQKFLNSGFSALDKVLGGLRKGTLNILAARPAMGKTALALNIARNIALNQKVVAIFSLEMSKEEIAMRLFSSEAMVNAKDLRNPKLFDKHENKLSTALMKLNQNCKLFIDDKAGTTVLDIISRCRQLKMQYGLDCIIIDYLQLMSGSRRSSSENRQQEISEISRALKVMAKDLEVPVIALSQLSRACELRADKRPLLSDLRESGSIEQDADTVSFLYREMYYATKEEDKVKLKHNDGTYEWEDVELHVAKNRGGEVERIFLGWMPQFLKFLDLGMQGLNQIEPPPDFQDASFASLEQMTSEFGQEEDLGFVLD